MYGTDRKTVHFSPSLLPSLEPTLWRQDSWDAEAFTAPSKGTKRPSPAPNFAGTFFGDGPFLFHNDYAPVHKAAP